MIVITDLTTVFWTVVFGNLVMIGLLLLVISSTANQVLDEIRGLKNQIIQVYETDDYPNFVDDSVCFFSVGIYSIFWVSIWKKLPHLSSEIYT